MPLPKNTSGKDKAASGSWLAGLLGAAAAHFRRKGDINKGDTVQDAPKAVLPDAAWKNLLAEAAAEQAEEKAPPPSSMRERPDTLMPKPVGPRAFPPDHPLYNGALPFIVVDTSNDHPGRGDSHGYIGLAAAVARKIGGRVAVLDRATLADIYPGVAGENNDVRHVKRLREYFNEHGYPDFYFNVLDHFDVRSCVLDAGGGGIVVSNFNENLPSQLLPGYDKSRLGNCGIVPHHLTPEALEREGRFFAEAYEGLPRPFIGVNFTYADDDGFVGALARLKEAYPQASFFLCGCHRTESDKLQLLAAKLEGLLGDADRYPVITFDYQFKVDHEGHDNFWNIYTGLIDQADHLIVHGKSASMVSEGLMRGRTVYTTYGPADTLGGALRSFWEHPGGQPLETRTFAPVDVMSDCVEALVDKHAAHKKSLRGKAAKAYTVL